MADLVSFDLPTRSADRETQRTVGSLQNQLNRQGFIERQLTTRLEDRYEYGHAIDYFKRSATTTFESHECLGNYTNAGALGTVATATNTMIAVPFVVQHCYTIDTIEMEVTTGSAANGKARVGIYDSLDDLNGTPYPGAMIAQSAQFDATTIAVKTTTVTAALIPGRVYFACYLCGTANPTVRAIPLTNVHPFLQFPSTLGTASQYAYTVAETFSTGGLPPNYASGATAVTAASVPAVFVKYSGVYSQTRYFQVLSPSLPGYVLRRVKILSGVGLTQMTGTSYVTIEPCIQTVDGTTALATFDSRSGKIQAGTPRYLVGPEELDLNLAVDSQYAIRVTYYGVCTQSIRDLVVQSDVAFTGAPS